MSSVLSDTHRVHTDGGLLFVQRWHTRSTRADAAPIVLFHDSLGCVSLWRDFPERLAEATSRCVLAYDRLGFGRSDPHPDRLRPDFIRSEAPIAFHALRQQIGFADFIAFGHSVGGGMAVGCAAAYREHCRALITESAQAFIEHRTRQGILDARQAFAQPGQIERLSRYHGDKAAWVLSAWIDTWLGPAFADWNLDAELRQVHCPVLALHGEHDEYGSPAQPERIATLTAGPSRLHVLHNCGHVPHREHPATVLGLIVDWLATVAR